MGMFDYKDYSSAESLERVEDAAILMAYAYHNIDYGVSQAYENICDFYKLPMGLLPKWRIEPPEIEKMATETINNAGWKVLTPEQLGYEGKTDHWGTYIGETFRHTSDQVEILGKYDEAGKLTSIGISYRGTTGPRETFLIDTARDLLHDAEIAIGQEKFCENYTKNAYDQLLSDVADFAKANGLTGEDIIVTGHSLGGMMVNSMASQSESSWEGFYSDASYIAFASPTQYEQGDKVLNIGFENDPVFRALDGEKTRMSTFLTHDGEHASSSDNIVNFNDYYASDIANIGPFSILNIPAWISHLPFFYTEGMQRISDSAFYELMDRDSTVVVSTLSSQTRDKVWVEDLGRDAEPRHGSTFILGSDNADLLRGGKNNDYLEGNAGNDTLQDKGGYNIINGGEGTDIFDTQSTQAFSSAAYNGNTLYLMNKDGEISLLQEVETLRTRSSALDLFSHDINWQITEEGLKSGRQSLDYNNTLHGSEHSDRLSTSEKNSWLFGNGGNDTLTGSKGDDVLDGGTGNDTLTGGKGSDTFLFTGVFGHDVITDFGSTDRIVFMATGDSATGEGFNKNNAEQQGRDVLLHCGDNSVTLSNMLLSDLNMCNIIIA